MTFTDYTNLCTKLKELRALPVTDAIMQERIFLHLAILDFQTNHALEASDYAPRVGNQNAFLA